jgi:hypothetical protein
LNATPIGARAFVFLAEQPACNSNPSTKDLFKQRTRLADADHKLLKKTTIGAAESRSIAGTRSSGTRAGCLSDLRRTKPDERNGNRSPSRWGYRRWTAAWCWERPVEVGLRIHGARPIAVGRDPASIAITTRPSAAAAYPRPNHDVTARPQFLARLVQCRATLQTTSSSLCTRVLATMGGAAEVQKFYRFYLTPGLTHTGAFTGLSLFRRRNRSPATSGGRR